MIFKVKVELPWRYRSRSKVITWDTPSHASDHLYQYGKNPSRTVDATGRTRFSTPRPNDLEDIGQGQRSLYATHPLIQVIICPKYGKNPSRTVDFFSRSRLKKFKNLSKIKISRFWKKPNTQHHLMIVIICAKYKKNPSRTVEATERTRFFKSRPNDLEDIGQGQGSSYATHPPMLLIICTKYGKNLSCTVDAKERTRDAGWTDRWTDGRTDGVKPIYPPTTSLCGGYKKQHSTNDLGICLAVDIIIFLIINWCLMAYIKFDYKIPTRISLVFAFTVTSHEHYDASNY